MLTIADALQMAEFAGADVMAGADNLTRPVKWVYNTSVPDPYNWLDGGELVLTTARNMPPTEAEQIATIRALAERRIAGLVVTVGRDIDVVPPAWCEAAAACGLPLITLPYQTRFVTLARAVNERIAQASLFMMRRALHIHQVLTRLVLEDGGLDDLAQVMADLIGQSVSIETRQFEALASANIAAIDEARRYTLEHGRTNPALIQWLEDDGTLPHLRETRTPAQLPKIPEVGLELERILAPVVVHGDLYGYIWIIGDGSPLQDIDRMAIESGATVAALMMLHQEAVQTAEASLRGGVLAQLIEYDSRRDALLTEKALRYGLDLHRPYRMLLVETATMGNGALAQLDRRLNRLARDQHWAAVVGQFAGQVLLLLDARAAHDEVAGAILTRVGTVGAWVGVSAVHQAPAAASDAYTQCQEALVIARRLHHPQRIAVFDDLGYVYALYRAGAASLRGNPLAERLRRLREETQADLFQTLEVYLDVGGNGVAAAEALYIHRSTLNYRLNRITQLTQADLTDPGTRVNLQMTLKQLRLFDA
jgi:PucR family transcriptional regulator, purine catabolism regulatory protein